MDWGFDSQTLRRAIRDGRAGAPEKLTEWTGRGAPYSRPSASRRRFAQVCDVNIRPLSSSAQSSSSSSVIVGGSSPLLNCTEQLASATTARFRASIRRSRAVVTGGEMNLVFRARRLDAVDAPPGRADVQDQVCAGIVLDHVLGILRLRPVRRLQEMERQRARQGLGDIAPDVVDRVVEIATSHPARPLLIRRLVLTPRQIAAPINPGPMRIAKSLAGRTLGRDRRAAVDGHDQRAGLARAQRVLVEGRNLRRAPGCREPACDAHERGSATAHAYFALATLSFRSMSEKQTVRLRPPCLALYSAWSARAMSSGFSRESSG